MDENTATRITRVGTTRVGELCGASRVMAPLQRCLSNPPLNPVALPADTPWTSPLLTPGKAAPKGL